MNSWIYLGTPRVSYQAYRQWNYPASQTWASSLPLTSRSVYGTKTRKGICGWVLCTNSRYLVYICTWGCKPNQSGTKYAPYNLAAELTRSAKGTLGVIIPVVSEKDCHVFLRICSDDADIRFTTTHVFVYECMSTSTYDKKATERCVYAICL